VDTLGIGRYYYIRRVCNEIISTGKVVFVSIASFVLHGRVASGADYSIYVCIVKEA